MFQAYCLESRIKNKMKNILIFTMLCSPLCLANEKNIIDASSVKIIESIDNGAHVMEILQSMPKELKDYALDCDILAIESAIKSIKDGKLSCYDLSKAYLSVLDQCLINAKKLSPPHNVRYANEIQQVINISASIHPEMDMIEFEQHMQKEEHVNEKIIANCSPQHRRWHLATRYIHKQIYLNAVKVLSDEIAKNKLNLSPCNNGVLYFELMRKDFERIYSEGLTELELLRWNESYEELDLKFKRMIES